MEGLEDYFNRVRLNRDVQQAPPQQAPPQQTPPQQAPPLNTTSNANGSSSVYPAALNQLMCRASRDAPAPSVPPNPPPPPQDGTGCALLPPRLDANDRRNVLVLDLDETLVHSSFDRSKYAPGDLILPISYLGGHFEAYVKLRPHLLTFLSRMAEIFEVVIFTASVPEYADPLLDRIDPRHVLCHHRLYRSHCTPLPNNTETYVKDLSRLNRPINKVVIMDNAPIAFMFQPRNGIQCGSFFDDPADVELLQFAPFLEEVAKLNNIYPVMDEFRKRLQLQN